MARIPAHTIEDAPAAARPLRTEMIGLSPAGRLLNRHAPMAQDVGEAKLDALTGVVRDAAANCGRISDATWEAAAGQGWDDTRLAEAFAYLGLTVFTSYFLNYAATELDVPTGPAQPGEDTPASPALPGEGA